MSDSDTTEFEAFRAAMGDVKPIKRPARVKLQSSADLGTNLRARREAATATVASEINDLSGEFIEPVDPSDILSFQRPGIQNGVFRNLRLGKYAIEARLDLHRHTVEQAREAVFRFVSDCLKHDIRCALITHGKGEGRKQPAVLKSCIAHWLPQLAEVMAFHSAQKQHGASGATYIMLRKSERKRQDNLERHQKRRL
ncbi:DNA endonuclease SmrA [Aestuariicella hydrocarbonica]|uniref:DNA endonuclease SmrA n=1 Tax=Pseudomaricurvus hydrocarbonicus TaxID=1470433 RepID=A0A9E5JX62_9GAMM|nr:DNA endonuclease SmrA [Aestuariicella hydrocarbonica]NHO66934.1 DNA endonuclease SmrA [Aestuariicella hydrocarbonica]